MDSSSTPEECLAGLAAAGLPPPLIEQLKMLHETRGIHPMRALEVMMDNQRGKPEEEPQEKMLESFSLEGIARYIAEKEVKKIVVMCGAGISTSAGIPDFRSPGSGLYDNLQKYDLPVPEAIFEMNFFRSKPDAFYELAKDMWPGNYHPTPCHYFIKLLHEKGLLLRCYSQNIDSLECQAGLPADKLVAAHGNFDAAHIIDTDPEVEVPIAELKAAVEKGKEGWQALREEKGGLVKPKIVFFGEALPERFAQLSDPDLEGCDLLIVLGTSLVVAPFNGLVGEANKAAPRLLINREQAGTCDRLQHGFRFHKQEEGQNWRDVFHGGDIDAGCFALAEALGWKADLEALIESKGTAEVAPAPWR